MKKRYVYIILIASLIAASIIGRVFPVIFKMSKLLAMLCIIFAIVQTPRFRYPKLLNYYLVFILWCGISSLFIGADLNIVYKYLITLIQISVFFFFSYNMAYKEINFKNLGYIIFFVVTFIILSSLLVTNNPLQISPDRYQGLTNNPNNLGLYLNYFIAAVFYFTFKFKNRISLFLVFLFLVVLSLYFLLLSGSRSSFFAFIPVLIVYIYFCKIFSKKVLIYLSILGVSFLIFSNSILSFIFDASLFQRTANLGLMQNSTEIRIDNATAAWNVFLKNPIAGVGFNNFILHNPHGMVAHNYYLEILASTGMIGFVILFCLYFKLARLSIKALKTEHLYYEGVFAILFLTITFGFSFAFHLYDSMFHWIIISIIYAVLNKTKLVPRTKLLL